MDSKLSLSFFVFLLLVVTISSSSVQAADQLQEFITPILTYWKSVLPQTPIPATIERLLHPAAETENYSFEVEKAPTIYISYKSAATENQMQNDRNAQLFLKRSITPGTKMVLDLTGTTSSPPFLSLKDSMAAPFSSGKLPEILGLFSIQRGSLKAAAVRRALAECEEPPLDGESKRCVTSLESMVEFIEAELGDGDVRIVETAVARGGLVSGRQEYVVGSAGPRLLRAEGVVSCHSEPYPRALYYCHATKHIEIYKVHMLGANGIVVDAVMTCHTNTSAWNPDYIGFRMLRVKPGTEPICHFMPQGNLIFALLSKKANLMS
ncbi:BURP domain-containing protein 3 [Platanthera zijinensis]|uniref:BURP domain-containing protein 3 n=1 Tax=Platanthera zijinensis TaxID=2320716 RepID=A0AAP0FVD8_9ASPA